MLRERSSRLLLHVALALAGACLIYAERDFLPEMQYVLVPFLALVFFAWKVGERWVLPIWAANLLGVLIVLSTGWLLHRHYNEMYSWLPHLGPVLMCLLLVKLFRAPGGGDWWLLHGLGLLQVGLGCVLTRGPIFGVLMLAYFAATLCCLAAHYRHSERTSAEPAGLTPPPHWGRFGLRWTFAVVLLAVPLFLLTPRGDSPPWEPLAGLGAARAQVKSAQTGLSAEMNLNRTGALEIDQGAAFAVTAVNADGSPKLDLPGDQRWRGVVLDHYRDGLWSSALQQNNVAAIYRVQRREEPVSGGYELHFTLHLERAGALILADPVRLGPLRGQVPVSSLGPRQRRQLALFGESSGTVIQHFFLVPGEYRYRQIVPTDNDRDRYPAVRVVDGDGVGAVAYAEQLVSLPRRRGGLHRLPEWTAALLRTLADRPRYRHYGLRLPGPGPDDEGPLLRESPELWAATALLLTEYLASSGEYTYTLVLARHDADLDPTLDFLMNVKQGHCERYSAGLALMLRSLGVPCRIVKGFRGVERQRENHYLVRQSHAHSWVEALVPRRGEPKAFDWLVLDPTPDIDAPAPVFSLTRWWDERRRDGQDLWQELIVGYNANQQADLWEDLASPRLLVRAAVVVFAVVGLALSLWAWRRRSSRRHTDPPGFYARLLALLDRHAGLRPSLAQTPREFARRAKAALAATGPLADVPERVVEVFYRVRFGGRALDEVEGRALEAQLDALASALRGLTSPPARPGPSP
jgi:hypothetical protein